jgi:hypothetical protein
MEEKRVFMYKRNAKCFRKLYQAFSASREHTSHSLWLVTDPACGWVTSYTLQHVRRDRCPSGTSWKDVVMKLSHVLESPLSLQPAANPTPHLFNQHHPTADRRS